MKRDLIAIVGPTASGKTHRAVDLARRIGGEIISADSRQVYRGMTIGTGKDLSEYGDVPYHLVDIAEAGEKYNLHRYLRDFETALEDIRRRGKNAVVCGGSGLYVESALAGLRLPEVPRNDALRESLSGRSLEELASILASMKKLHNVTDVDSCQRAVRAIEIEQYYIDHPDEARCADRSSAKPLDALIVGVDVSRDIRRRRITERLHARLEEGMAEEVRSLLNSGIAPEDLIYYGLEYKFVTLYVTGKISREDMITGLETAIHQFAKRQMTWFRGMERRGFRIHWIDGDLSDDEFASRVLSLL